jgi:membrane-associated phospholipid phosphatase
MYDAWSAYTPVAASTALDPAYRRPASEHSSGNKSMAVSYAAYRCLLNLFPAGSTRLTQAFIARGFDPGYTQTDAFSPAGIGNAAAQAVIAARADDGANQYGTLRSGAYSDYTWYAPRNAPMPFCMPRSTSCPSLAIAQPRAWQPLIADSGAVQSFIAPHWGRVRPFGFASATDFDRSVSASASSSNATTSISIIEATSAPTPAVVTNDSAYRTQADAILGFSAGLTPQRKLIVEYWADGPASELPPGHWGILAQHVARRDRAGIDHDVKMFFVMHSASMDAGIVAWHLKRKFDGPRPITMIRHLRQGQSILAWGGPGRPVEWIAGERWLPYNPGSNLTPAFPGFVSGHTTFSWASATVLRLYKLSDALDYSVTLPADFGRVEPGVPPVPTTLRYDTFSQAATDAGLSRLWGGIHVEEDNDYGRRIGVIVALRAWRKAQSLFAGYR